jgi:steroid delta-isomerase-like uncharacterized protein
MTDAGDALVRRFIEELDREHTPSEELVDENFVSHIPGLPLLDRSGYREFVASLYAAFPDFKHEIEDVISEGDKVVIRCTVTGSHKGQFAGVAGTGRNISNTVIAIFRISDGKLAEEWAVSDTTVLMQQIGADPS